MAFFPHGTHSPCSNMPVLAYSSKFIHLVKFSLFTFFFSLSYTPQWITHQLYPPSCLGAICPYHVLPASLEHHLSLYTPVIVVFVRVGNEKKVSTEGTLQETVFPRSWTFCSLLVHGELCWLLSQPDWQIFPRGNQTGAQLRKFL